MMSRPARKGAAQEREKGHRWEDEFRDDTLSAADYGSDEGDRGGGGVIYSALAMRQT